MQSTESKNLMEIPDGMAKEIEIIQSSCDTKWLLSSLESLLLITTENVIRISATLKRLEDLGVDIEIDVPALQVMRKVAYGQILPELFVSLQGDPVLLEKSSSLPHPEQRRIAQNTPMKVMEADGDFRRVPPKSMTRKEIQQVFHRGKIRGDAAQVGWLRDKVMHENNGEAVVASIRLDRKRGGIVIDGGKFISAAELAHFLAELGKRRG